MELSVTRHTLQLELTERISQRLANGEPITYHISRCATTSACANKNFSSLKDGCAGTTRDINWPKLIQNVTVTQLEMLNAFGFHDEVDYPRQVHGEQLENGAFQC